MVVTVGLERVCSDVRIEPVEVALAVAGLELRVIIFGARVGARLPCQITRLGHGIGTVVGLGHLDGDLIDVDLDEHCDLIERRLHASRDRAVGVLCDDFLESGSELLLGDRDVQVLALGVVVLLLALGAGSSPSSGEQLHELVHTQAEHLPVLFLGEPGDTADACVVPAGAFPGEVTRP